MNKTAYLAKITLQPKAPLNRFQRHRAWLSFNGTNAFGVASPLDRGRDAKGR